MKIYAYTPQGYASPNGQTWHLPQNTEVLARCCIGDLDCDGIKDMVEAEVAWAFRPYLVFDHGEDNDLADGLIILYQAHPEIIDPGEKIRIKIKMTFTFPGDRTHDGDTQSSSFWVESTDSEHQSWQVVQVSWRHLSHTYLSEHQCDWDGVRRNQWLRSDGPSADWIEWHLDETTGLYHQNRLRVQLPWRILRRLWRIRPDRCLEGMGHIRHKGLQIQRFYRMLTFRRVWV